MKKFIIALFIISGGLSASGQFFSKEESAALKTAEPEMKKDLPEAEQKKVYVRLCEAELKAHNAAAQRYPIIIHQTPDQRAAQQKKADTAKAALLKHYKGDLVKTFEITEDCLAQIEKTGKEKKWPQSSKPVTTE
jgi:hypothetical protein